MLSVTLCITINIISKRKINFNIELNIKLLWKELISLVNIINYYLLECNTLVNLKYVL